MSIINTSEIRRLEKAAKEKDKQKLYEWASQLEGQINENLRRQYEAKYQEEIKVSVGNFIIANMYSLYFSEETKLKDKHSLAEFMSDLFTTIDMFRTGEYKPDDYKSQLQEEGVFIDEDYDYDKIYKDFLHTVDNDLVRFLKGEERRKIIYIIRKFQV